MAELMMWLFAPLALFVVLFLVFRRVMLWYWLIDEAIYLLASIDESLKAFPAVREMRAAQHRAAGRLA